ncbi:MAG: hypothetical protein IH870_09295 [Chloroflexi bacterium]|nr:hypothetical protein [Chloroflexota bacterium]
MTAVVMFAMTLSFGGATDVFAGKGGCPNDGGGHSQGADNTNGNNGKSAHGSAKQTDRGCS